MRKASRRTALACFLAAHAVHAQDVDGAAVGGTSRTPNVEEVHVRGSQAGDFESRASVDDAPREITDAASLVEPLVGVHVRRLGADDGFATMSIRGSSSNQVAFYLAGVPLPAAGDPTIDLSTLPLWPGSQVRVHRTFTPGSLGPGSLGGTLVLDPPSATGPERTDIWIAGGSLGTLRMRMGDVSDLGHGVRIASGLSAARSDGDFSYYNVDHNAPTDDPRSYVPRLNNDFAQGSGLVSLVVPLGMGASRSGTMRATVMLQDREQGLPGTIFTPTPFERLRTDRELGTVELAMPAARGVIGAQLWGVREGTDFRDAPNSLQEPTLERTTITSAGGAASWKARFGTVSIASKLDARGERYEPGDYVGPTRPTGASRSAFGAGADGEWKPTRSLALAASARIDGWSDTSDDPTIASSFTAMPNAHVGIDAALGVISLAAHGGYTSRPANFVERFGAPGGFIATPTLLPESAWTVDAGAHLRKRFGKLEIDAEVDGFAQEAHDLITFEAVGFRNLLKAENIGQAAIVGIEAELLMRLFGAELRASYTGLHTENDSMCSSAGCPPLPGRPAHDLVVDLSYQLGPLRLRYGVDALAGIVLDTANAIPVPARILQSVGARLDVPHAPGVRVSLDVRNLFDLRTASYFQPFENANVTYPIGDAYFYPLPGRSILMSLAWQPRLLTR